MKKILALGLALTLTLSPFFERQANATVSVQTPQNVYAANSSTTVWAYTFKVFLSTDIAVYSTSALGVKTLVTSNYTVDTNGQTVTYPSVVSGLPPIATGITITITRASPLSQTLSLVNQGQFDAGNIEMAFDKLVLIDQEQALAIASGVPGPQGATGATGPQGPANTLSIGTVTSGTAAATITGSSPNQTLNLVLQAGPTGPTGPQGPTGSGSGDVLGPATNTDGFIPQWNGANTKTLKNGVQLDTDGTLAANSATRVPAQSAVKTYADTKAAKGANSDITSLTALSTPLSVAQGGIGRASQTAYAVLCGGTTTTAAQQSIVSVGTAGQILTSAGAGALPTFQTNTSATGNLLSTHTFTASGTWTKPANCNQARVIVVGAGGGGGLRSAPYGPAGGGGGGYAERFITSSLGATETVTVGTNGAGADTTRNGIAGGNSAFGTWATANGGAGNSSTTGGAGGSAASGDWNVTGGQGGDGSVTANAPIGDGGGSVLASGGKAGISHAYSGSGPGAGGAGNSAGSGTGGNGTDGVVIVYEYS